MTPSQLASIAMLMSLPVRHVWPTWRSCARGERASVGMAGARHLYKQSAHPLAIEPRAADTPLAHRVHDGAACRIERVPHVLIPCPHALLCGRSSSISWCSHEQGVRRTVDGRLTSFSVGAKQLSCYKANPSICQHYLDEVLKVTIGK